MWFYLIILRICLFRICHSRSIIAKSDLNFKLNPINNHNFVQQINDINYNSTCCIRYKLNITELQDLQLVKLNIENIIPKYTNIDRFGGSSDSQGKQFIQLTIKSWPSGNLIRYKRYLPNGENNIVFNIMSLKDTEIETCLTNLSYDASWNLMDLDKMIQYEITTLSKEKIKINEFCQKTVTNKHFLNVHDVLQDVREINSHWKDPSWNKLQVERRWYNENTFTWTLYQIVILLLCLCGNFIYIIWRLNNI
ncbi:hypothetical protein MOUN0_J08460 [Monosporozyma unispora]